MPSSSSPSSSTARFKYEGGEYERQRPAEFIRQFCKTLKGASDLSFSDFNYRWNLCGLPLIPMLPWLVHYPREPSQENARRYILELYESVTDSLRNDSASLDEYVKAVYILYILHESHMMPVTCFNQKIKIPLPDFLWSPLERMLGLMESMRNTDPLRLLSKLLHHCMSFCSADYPRPCLYNPDIGPSLGQKSPEEFSKTGYDIDRVLFFMERDSRDKKPEPRQIYELLRKKRSYLQMIGNKYAATSTLSTGSFNEFSASTKAVIERHAQVMSRFIKRVYPPMWGSSSHRGKAVFDVLSANATGERKLRGASNSDLHIKTMRAIANTLKDVLINEKYREIPKVLHHRADVNLLAILSNVAVRYQAAFMCPADDPPHVSALTLARLLLDDENVSEEDLLPPPGRKRKALAEKLLKEEEQRQREQKQQDQVVQQQGSSSGEPSQSQSRSQSLQTSPSQPQTQSQSTPANLPQELRSMREELAEMSREQFSPDAIPPNPQEGNEHEWMRAQNKSGIKGVLLRRGIYLVRFKQLGKQKTKSYSSKKYGKEGARWLAVEFRRHVAKAKAEGFEPDPDILKSSQISIAKRYFDANHKVKDVTRTEAPVSLSSFANSKPGLDATMESSTATYTKIAGAPTTSSAPAVQSSELTNDSPEGSKTSGAAEKKRRGRRRQPATGRKKKRPASNPTARRKKRSKLAAGGDVGIRQSKANLDLAEELKSDAQVETNTGEEHRQTEATAGYQGDADPSALDSMLLDIEALADQYEEESKQ